ncbi:MAG: hypothetical protein GY870_02810 [archaeon]|nr:hypothetical protein [archaeon]
MIQFCEDCGQKNILDSKQIVEEKAVFQCSVCNYHNCFHIKLDKKPYSEKLLELGEIKGVKLYILVDQNGDIAATNIKHPKKTADMVLSCAKNSFTIGEPDLKYVIFPRKNQNHFFIFQTGNSYLGVIKQVNISKQTLTDNILYFLKELNAEEA